MGRLGPELVFEQEAADTFRLLQLAELWRLRRQLLNDDFDEIQGVGVLDAGLMLDACKDVL